MMRVLPIAVLMVFAQAGAQQLPCDLVPEEQLPKCHFTVRSNYGLHARVHTARVVSQQLAPDPRARGKAAGDVTKLWIREPGIWLVFTPDGELIENAGSIGADGNPVGVSREKRSTVGNTTITVSGTEDDPEAFRSERVSDSEGNLVEERAYQKGRLITRHVVKRDTKAGTAEETTYDAEGGVLLRSVGQTDARGRWIISRHYDHDQLTLESRDTYDDSRGDTEDAAFASRAWYDAQGVMFRQIAVRDGELSWWWQSPKCGKVCESPLTLGFNFSFHRTTDLAIQPDGSLLTTIEHHEARYGNIDNDDVELRDQHGTVLERILYRYVRDEHGNWTERTTAILDPSTGRTVDVRRDTRTLTYY